MTNQVATDWKALVPDRAISQSVIDNPAGPNSSNPTPQTLQDANSLFFFLGQYADEIAPWGSQWKLRDSQLRRFITQENIFAAALGIICSRNAGFSWNLDGPERTVNQFQYILETANQGKGWHDLIVKTTIDLSTQDNGAFWEIVRSSDSPSAAFIGLNHLDAARCTHTGNPEAPVIYQDRLNKLHLLKWYQVIELAEMPGAVEGFYGLQYSALTRLLRKMQIARNIDVFDFEKTGGRNTRAIHLVKGVTSQQLNDAISQARTLADSSGLTKYMDPVVVGTIDPKADVGHDTINLVDLPENFDAETFFKHYINLIAMAFESDYQEFAPLPGGGLGTGAQSEMLHLKSRGKGPATFMKLITQAINFKIAPKNIVFKFAEKDLEAEKLQAEVRSIRAQTRAVRINSMEINPAMARQEAVDAGDLLLEHLAMIGEQDLTPDITANDESITQKPSTMPSPVSQPPEVEAAIQAAAQRVTPQRGNNMNYNGSRKEGDEDEDEEEQRNILERIKDTLLGRNDETIKEAVEVLADTNSTITEELIDVIEVQLDEVRRKAKEESDAIAEQVKTNLEHGLEEVAAGLHQVQSAALTEINNHVDSLQGALKSLAELQLQATGRTEGRMSEILDMIAATNKVFGESATAQSREMIEQSKMFTEQISKIAEQNAVLGSSLDATAKRLVETREDNLVRIGSIREEIITVREEFNAAQEEIAGTIARNKVTRVRKEVIRLDPNDPYSPIKEVIEHYD